MRKGHYITASMALCCASASIAAADYYLKIEGVAPFTGTDTLYLKVQSSEDADGDGAPDTGIVHLACVDGKLQSARLHHEVRSPRDVASGQATGKRMHRPLKIIKEWGPATPQLYSMKITPKIAKESHGRMTADAAGWTPLDVENGDALCPAAEDAARKATKTRSNIQNN